MSITFTCRCGNELRTADSNAGKPGKCPACSMPFIVPDSNGQAIATSQANVSDYPLRRVTRQPVREKSRFDGLTSDDVQLRPRLDEEDAEQRIERRRHRLPNAVVTDDEVEDVGPRPSRARPIAIIATGVLVMIGAGVWFRWKLEYGVIVPQAPLLFVAGAVLTLVGGLGYYRRSTRRIK
jgi:hypothetical protein